MLMTPGAALKGTSSAMTMPRQAKGIVPTSVRVIIRAYSERVMETCATVMPRSQAKGSRGTAFRYQVSEGRHRTGALEFQPTGAELAGEASADAEERCAHHAEYGVGGEHVLCNRDAADVLAAIHDETEEDVEDNRKSNDGKRERAGAKEADELEAGFGEEYPENVREGIRTGGGKGGGGCRHYGLLEIVSCPLRSFS